MGQLGDGTLVSRQYATSQVLQNVIAVSAGAYHSLALKADGTVWAWGKNYSGQLGDGSNIQRTLPVQVLGLTGIAAIAGGRDFSLALKADGTVWAWGEIWQANWDMEHQLVKTLQC
jgi:alpha-tubulin suppressor-like RCC1 family protein